MLLCEQVHVANRRMVLLGSGACSRGDKAFLSLPTYP